jgi:hypothetical protein
MIAVVAVLLVSACSTPPPASVVFPPLSYNANLPRVSFYPQLVMPGKEVVILARPMRPFTGETCLRVIDVDAFAWHETCWEGGDSRRIPFRPMKPGRYVGYLAYASGDGWLTTAKDKAELCVLGEDANCP